MAVSNANRSSSPIPSRAAKRSRLRRTIGTAIGSALKVKRNDRLATSAAETVSVATSSVFERVAKMRRTSARAGSVPCSTAASHIASSSRISPSIASREYSISPSVYTANVAPGGRVKVQSVAPSSSTIPSGTPSLGSSITLPPGSASTGAG